MMTEEMARHSARRILLASKMLTRELAKIGEAGLLDWIELRVGVDAHKGALIQLERTFLGAERSCNSGTTPGAVVAEIMEIVCPREIIKMDEGMLSDYGQEIDDLSPPKADVSGKPVEDSGEEGESAAEEA